MFILLASLFFCSFFAKESVMPAQLEVLLDRMKALENELVDELPKQ